MIWFIGKRYSFTSTTKWIQLEIGENQTEDYHSICQEYGKYIFGLQFYIFWDLHANQFSFLYQTRRMETV